nr:hypothetical protein [Micromonospora sp. DSM 115978]
ARFTAASVLRPRLRGGWAWEFVVHHLFFDAYGLGLFTRRVAEVYSALVAGEAVPPRWFGSYAELVGGVPVEAEADAEADADVGAAGGVGGAGRS